VARRERAAYAPLPQRACGALQRYAAAAATPPAALPQQYAIRCRCCRAGSGQRLAAGNGSSMRVIVVRRAVCVDADTKLVTAPQKYVGDHVNTIHGVTAGSASYVVNRRLVTLLYNTAKRLRAKR